MPEAVIVSAVRSAVGRGKPDGALASVHPVELSAHLIRAAVDRAGVTKEDADDVLWGCAMSEASQGLNVARNAALCAGLPVDSSAATINRFCSSGLQAVAQATQAVMSGWQDVIVAGGVEMMSQVPMSGYHTRLHPELAERYGVTREDQDAFALVSQQRAARALERGAFDDQIVPIPVPRVRWEGAKKHVETHTFARDETPRPGT